jgi:hypothetical protein
MRIRILSLLMAKCPHCNKEVQEEAIFCRYCRRDIKPPLWLSSLHKCPFCAEWIEQDLEVCPLCDKDLSHILSPKVPPFTQKPPTDRISDEFFESLLYEEPTETLLSPPAPPEKRPAKPPPPALTPEEPPPSSPVKEDEVSSLRKILFEEPSVRGRMDGIFTSRLEPDRIRSSLVTSLLRILRRVFPILLGIVIVAAIIFLALGPGRNFFLKNDEPTPVSTPQILPSPTRKTLPTLTSTSQPEDTPTATSTSATPTCFHWDQISLDDAGREVCVYGQIKRWFSSGDVAFFALFSEDPDAFALVDYTESYPEVKPGACVMVEGIVELLGSGRPSIELTGTIQFCSEELEGSL